MIELGKVWSRFWIFLINDWATLQYNYGDVYQLLKIKLGNVWLLQRKDLFLNLSIRLSICLSVYCIANKTLQQCPGRNFTEVACMSGYRMDVIDANLVYIKPTISFTPTQCTTYSHPEECLVSIPNLYDLYYRTIVDRCQGHTSCDGLSAVSGQSGVCFPNRGVAFVRIIYRCLIGTCLISW